MSTHTIAVAPFVAYDPATKEVYFKQLNKVMEGGEIYYRIVTIRKPNTTESTAYQESAWRSGAVRLYNEPGVMS